MPLKEYFEAKDIVACIGSWSEADMFQIAILRLFDSVRAFHYRTRERHDSNISWANFQAIFQRYFPDVKTDHYHFTQLQTARQRKGEILKEFEDRSRNLAQRTVIQAEDPVLQRVYYEQAKLMLLASFISDLSGTPGRQLRFEMPTNLDETLNTAITVEQSEAQERRNEAFFLEAEAQRPSTVRRGGNML